MKVLVCGNRVGWDDVQAELDKLHRFCGITVLIQGGEAGVEAQAASWALKNGVTLDTFPVEWERGRRADGRRNQRMIDTGQPEMVVAFPGGTETGDVVIRSLKSQVRVLQVTKSGWTTT